MLLTCGRKSGEAFFLLGRFQFPQCGRHEYLDRGGATPFARSFLIEEQGLEYQKRYLKNRKFTGSIGFVMVTIAKKIPWVGGKDGRIVTC